MIFNFNFPWLNNLKPNETSETVDLSKPEILQSPAEKDGSWMIKWFEPDEMYPREEKFETEAECRNYFSDLKKRLNLN